MMREVTESTTYLDYIPPFDWDFFLHYFQTRSTPGVEAVVDGRYVRTISIDNQSGVLLVSHDADKRRLIMTVRGEAQRLVQKISPRVRHMFDLDADMVEINKTLAKDRSLRQRIAASPGIRVPGTWSAFEVIARAIVGQQVSVKAASTIIGRIADRVGASADIPNNIGLGRQFPTPRAIASADLSGIGMPGKRAEALSNVARAIINETIPFCDEGLIVQGVKESLLDQPGIGPWTAEYFSLRALRQMDAWPGTDLVLRRTLVPDPATKISLSNLEALSAKWKPWRAYVAMHLWRNAHAEGQIKKERV
jgi:DNA-3-methyladenine glycosylase II